MVMLMTKIPKIPHPESTQGVTITEVTLSELYSILSNAPPGSLVPSVLNTQTGNITPLSSQQN